MLDPRITTEQGLEEMSVGIRNTFHRVHFVYAHGKLADDLGTDIIYLQLFEQRLHDGLIAYTDNWKPVRFHLYKHPRTLELVGIVTYCNSEDKDKEAYDYGRKLVKQKPDKF